jgi:hypothetical protein
VSHISPSLWLSIHPTHLAVNIGGIPHLAKNQRNVGHPSFVREPEILTQRLKAVPFSVLEEIYRIEVVAAGLTFFACVAELLFQQNKKVFLRRSESEAQRTAASLLSTIVKGCLHEGRSD